MRRPRRSAFPPNKDTSISVIYKCRGVGGEIGGPSSANATPCRTPVPPVLSGRDQVFLAPSVDDFAAYRVYGSRKNTPKLWRSYGATSRSLLRHAGFAQAREIGRFEPGVDRRRHDGAGNAENREVERWPSVELINREGFAARIILVGSLVEIANAEPRQTVLAGEIPIGANSPNFAHHTAVAPSSASPEQLCFSCLRKGQRRD